LAAKIKRRLPSVLVVKNEGVALWAAAATPPPPHSLVFQVAVQKLEGNPFASYFFPQFYA